MFIQIEPESDIPIYAQLASQLIEAIARGKLVGGDALPSVRSLAADLGMNMHTVNKAYHELEKKRNHSNCSEIRGYRQSSFTRWDS